MLTRAAAESLQIDGELHRLQPRADRRASSRARGRTFNTEKTEAFRTLVDHLVRKLSDILRAAFVHSEAGQQPKALQSGFGDLHSDMFDFSAMSRLVTRNVPNDELPAQRRERIEWALSVLRSPALLSQSEGRRAEVAPYEFAFDNCAAAIDAHRERLPHLVEVVKAIAIAELEARGGYVEADHDPFFERYDEHALTADDLALFPDYLVCIPADLNGAPENAAMMEMLSAGMPVKVLVQHSDLLEEAAIGRGHFAFGVRSARLATTAMGLGGMFVLQSSSSNLYALRDRVRRGMGCRGPALFSVFAGSPDAAGSLAPYLSAAAAMKSRAFPAFTYDANAGTNWATRFSFENNRNPEADWPVEEFAYADEKLQRVSEQVRFTYADFMLCDQRNAHHFAVVPRDRWSAAMVPAAEWLALPESQAADRVPYVLAVDGSDMLHRVIVDARLMQATRRCLLLWHRLQEHGGIHNSHAAQALAREKAAWEAQKEQEIEALRSAAGTAQVNAVPASEPPPRRRKRRLRPPPKRRRHRRRMSPGSKRRAARAATSARTSTTSCSATTRTSRRTSRTSTPALTRT